MGDRSPELAGRSPAGPGGTPGEGAPAPGGPDLLEVGRVGKPHGLRGEVSVHATSNRAERFDVGSTLVAALVQGGRRTVVVGAARRDRARWLVRFTGVDDLAAAEDLRGAVLLGTPLGPLDDPDELWVHELIGCDVWQRDRRLGVVVAVEANPAHDLLVLDGGVLVPMPFVVSTAPGRVEVDTPPGLVGETP